MLRQKSSSCELSNPSLVAKHSECAPMDSLADPYFAIVEQGSTGEIALFSTSVTSWNYLYSATSLRLAVLQLQVEHNYSGTLMLISWALEYDHAVMENPKKFKEQFRFLFSLRRAREKKRKHVLSPSFSNTDVWSGSKAMSISSRTQSFCVRFVHIQWEKTQWWYLTVHLSFPCTMTKLCLILSMMRDLVHDIWECQIRPTILAEGKLSNDSITTNLFEYVDVRARTEIGMQAGPHRNAETCNARHSVFENLTLTSPLLHHEKDPVRHHNIPACIWYYSGDSFQHKLQDILKKHAFHLESCISLADASMFISEERNPFPFCSRQFPA